MRDARRRTLLAALLTMAGAAGLFHAARAGEPSLEYRVKGAYLYKVAPFVAWPLSALPQPTSPFNLCLQGADPFGAALDGVVEGQRVGAHPIVVRRMESVDAAAGCQILFAGGSRRQSVTDALRAVRGTPVLTVTDGDRAEDARGIIHFVLHDGHVRFAIDAQAAAENGLEISPKLLSLAVSVRMRR
jgi:hypothetical protein